MKKPDQITSSTQGQRCSTLARSQSQKLSDAESILLKGLSKVKNVTEEPKTRSVSFEEKGCLSHSMFEQGQCSNLPLASTSASASTSTSTSAPIPIPTSASASASASAPTSAPVFALSLEKPPKSEKERGHLTHRDSMTRKLRRSLSLTRSVLSTENEKLKQKQRHLEKAYQSCVSCEAFNAKTSITKIDILIKTIVFKYIELEIMSGDIKFLFLSHYVNRASVYLDRKLGEKAAENVKYNFKQIRKHTVEKLLVEWLLNSKDQSIYLKNTSAVDFCDAALKSPLLDVCRVYVDKMASNLTFNLLATEQNKAEQRKEFERCFLTTALSAIDLFHQSSSACSPATSSDKQEKDLHKIYSVTGELVTMALLEGKIDELLATCFSDVGYEQGATA